MKPLLFFLFLIISVTPIAVAAGFSPSSIIYNLQPGEEECRMIRIIDSDSEKISVSDSWAEDKEEEWSVPDFETTSEEHSLYLDYPSELSQDEREFEVCLLGEEEGEYHGVILMKEEQQGNSVIQLAVWLKAIIEEPSQATPTPEEPPQESNNEEGEEGGGGGGGGGSTKPPTAQVDQEPQEDTPKDETPEPELLSDNNPQETAPITGAAISEGNLNPRNPAIPIIAIILIAITALTLYYRNKRRNQIYVQPQ
jgi:hypothetical protein